VARDRKNQEKLSSDGWRVRVVWECELQQEKLRKLVEWIKTESVVDLEEKRNAANSD
jgi:G:T-mismatch repair DNA endonuclease (very short patch repair protein)